MYAIQEGHIYCEIALLLNVKLIKMQPKCNNMSLKQSKLKVRLFLSPQMASSLLLAALLLII